MAGRTSPPELGAPQARAEVATYGFLTVRAQESTNPFASAFDLLAVPDRDLRALPLRDRWARLGDVLAGVEPPVQQVLATTDRDTALRWYRDLVPAGCLRTTAVSHQ